MVYRLAQISDTHLSRDKPLFVANFRQVVANLAAARPDLVVNTGDLALDGTHGEDDLAEARRLHDAIGLPVRYIPGNHDVGESPDVPGKEQPIITADARERYAAPVWRRFLAAGRARMAHRRHQRQLLGSDLPAADAQLGFVGAAVAGAEARSLALFVHKPLFHLSSGEDAITGRFVNPAARRRLLSAFGARPPALIASGHVHQYLSATLEGAAHVWCPSTGFILPDARQPRYGLKQTGYVEHALAADGSHTSRLVSVPGLSHP